MKKTRKPFQQHLRRAVSKYSSSFQQYEQPLLIDKSLLVRSHDETIEMLLENLTAYQEYCWQLIQIEKKKYKKYFSDMGQILREEYLKGMKYLQGCLGKMRLDFRKKRSDFLTLKDELRIMEGRERNMQKKVETLGNIKFEVQLVDVEVGVLDQFKKIVKKFRLKPQQNVQSEDIQAQNELKCEQKSTQTQFFEEKLQSQSATDQFEDLLSCDQDLSKKLSGSAHRRRKFCVGRCEVIRQQDQYSQSSVISES